MAFLTNGLSFTGAIGGLTAYKIKGSDKIIVRRKGGNSKEQIRHAPAFERTRENNTEFAGCSAASKAIRQVLFPVKHLADYNFTAMLTKLAKSIQLLDTAGDRGRRSILLSRYGDLLEGFQLNKGNPFDSVVRYPVACSIERETGSATIELPGLTPGINLVTPWRHPFFRFIVTMGLAPDIVYKENSYSRIEPVPLPETAVTEWQPVMQPFGAQTISLQLKELGALSDTKRIVVGIGIEMGQPVTNQVIERVKYGGSARILATG